MDIETIIAAGEKAFLPSLAVMKMKIRTKDNALIGRALWQAFHTDRIEPKTSEAWDLMARVPFTDLDAIKLLTFLTTENKDVVQDGWAKGLDGIMRQVENVELLRAVALTLPPVQGDTMLMNINRLTLRFDEEAFLQAVNQTPLPDWGRVADLLTFDGAPIDGGARIFAEAGWFNWDIPVGLHGLPHELDTLRTFRQLDFDATTAATGGTCTLNLPEDPDDAAQAAQLAAGWALGSDQPSEHVGPPDYRALTAVATRLGDDEDEPFGETDRMLVFPPLPPGETVKIQDHSEYTTYYAEHRGGTTLVWRAGVGEYEEAPALVARGMGAFLSYKANRKRENEPPEPSLASSVDARGDQGLEAWLSSLPLGSLILDFRDAALPVLISSPSMDKPVACGQVVLYAVGSRSEAIDGLLRRIAACGSIEAAAAAFSLHPVAMTGRLRCCHTADATVIELMPRTAAAHAEWMETNEAERTRARKAYEKPNFPNNLLPLDEVPALTASFLARYH